jgi:hypothetical protein
MENFIFLINRFFIVFNIALKRRSSNDLEKKIHASHPIKYAIQQNVLQKYGKKSKFPQIAI